jgi:sugar-specific transcriptional regulator TrmB
MGLPLTTAKEIFSCTHIGIKRILSRAKKMTLQDEIQTLRRLGLTRNQARVYLALARSGMSTAKTISTVSKIPREDVYRIMPQLRRLGLVEKGITAPAKFKAISIEEALFVLLQRRIEETSELQTKAGELLKNFKQNIAGQNLEEEEPQFILIPERETSLRRRRWATSNAQKSIVVVTSWKRFPRGLYTYAEEVEKALDRGVEVRFVTDQPENEDSMPNIIADFMKDSAFKIRYTTNPSAIIVAVYDGKEVYLVTSAGVATEETPALWSNNPSLVELARNYFEMIWNTALEYKQEEH